MTRAGRLADWAAFSRHPADGAARRPLWPGLVSGQSLESNRRGSRAGVRECGAGVPILIEAAEFRYPTARARLIGRSVKVDRAEDSDSFGFEIFLVIGLWRRTRMIFTGNVRLVFAKTYLL